MTQELSTQEYISENFHHLANHLTDEKELQAYQNLAPFFTGTEEQVQNLRQVGEITGEKIFISLANNLQRAITEALNELAQKIKTIKDNQ